MSEKVKLIELDFDIDALVKKTTEAYQNINKLTTSQKELKKTNTELQKELNLYAKALKEAKSTGNDKAVTELESKMKDLDSQIEKNTKTIITNQSSLKAQRTEYNTGLKAVDAYTQKTKQSLTVINQTDGSIDQLSAAISNNVVVYRSLSKEQRENAEIGGKLKELISEQRQEYKELQTEIGNTSVNVGNYQEDIENALAAQNLFNGGVNGLIGNFIALSQKEGGVKAFFSTTLSGLKGITKAALTFIATPLGAVIAAIVVGIKALQSYFKGSEEGQNKLNKAMAVFNSVLGNINDIVQKVGKNIFEAISKPKETAIELGNIIKDNILNRFKALGKIGKSVVKIFSKDWKSGLMDLANAGGQFATGIEDPIDKIIDGSKKAISYVKDVSNEISNEAKVAGQLADRQAALNVRERKFLVERAKLEAEISDLKQKASDSQNYTDKERIAFLESANKKETQILNTNLAIAQEKLNIKKQQNSLSNSTKEDLDEQANLEAELYRVQKDNSDKKKELVTQLATLEQGVSAENIANKKAQAEKAIEYAQKEIDIWVEKNQSKIQSDKDYSDDSVEAEQQRLNTLYDKQKDILDQQKEAGILSEQDYTLEKLKLQKEYIANVKDLEENFKTYKEEKRTEELEKENAQFERSLELRKLQGENEYNLQLEQLERKYTAEIEAATKKGEDVTALEQEYAAKREKIEESVQDAKINGLASVVGDVAELLGEETKAGKAAAAASATINALLAANEAYSAMASIPYVGPALGAVAAATALAAGYKNVKEIYATKAEKGIAIDIGGNRHSQGGTKFVGSDGTRFEAEKGEKMFILNRLASQKLGPTLSALNVASGGRPLWYATNYLASGGTVQTGSNSSKTLKSVAIDYEKMATYIVKALKSQPTPIHVVRVQDIITEINSYVAVVDGANI